MHFPRKPRIASMPSAVIALAAVIAAVVPALATDGEKARELTPHVFVPTTVALPDRIEPAPSAHDYVAPALVTEPVREGKGALMSY